MSAPESTTTSAASGAVSARPGLEAVAFDGLDAVVEADCAAEVVDEEVDCVAGVVVVSTIATAPATVSLSA